MVQQSIRVPLVATRRVVTLLLAVIGVLVVLHLVAVASGLEVLQRALSVDNEASVPTWWSSLQLAALATLLWTLRRRYLPGSLPASRALGVGAVTAAFFSLDEVAAIHESVTGVLERFDFIPRFSGEHGIWILVYGIVGVVVLGALLPGLVAVARSEPRTAAVFGFGAALFVGGGVGIEILGYFGEPMVLLEEALEMIGVAVMISAVHASLSGAFVGSGSDVTEVG